MTQAELTYNSVRKLPGWLGWVDFEILRALVSAQNAFSNDAILEIGVHHGKSLIPLARYSDDRKLYVVDLFDDQDKNIDASGSGDKTAFLANLKKFDVDPDRVTIDQRLSTDVAAQDIESRVGKVSFFHIDGGHHLDAVAADIELAINVSVDESIIVLDDVFRPEWPEVSMAAFCSTALADHGFRPFAIGFNKTYFCKRSRLSQYQDILRDRKNLEHHLTKIYEVHDRRVLVYQIYPLPEWGFAKRFMWTLSLWRPAIFNAIKPLELRLEKLMKRFLGR